MLRPEVFFDDLKDSDSETKSLLQVMAGFLIIKSTKVLQIQK